MQKLPGTHIFSAKNINVFAIFQDRSFNVMLANNFLKFWTTGPRSFNYFSMKKNPYVVDYKNCLGDTA